MKNAREEWIPDRIGFDARLISSLGIGRYIGGLLPQVAAMLRERLVVISNRNDFALVRALTGAQGTLVPSDATPYRLSEQTLLLSALLRARLPLVHFPHYDLPLAYSRRFVVTIHDLFSYRFPEIHSGVLPRAMNRALIANAVRRAAAIITPSRATAEDVAQHFPQAAKRITPIPEAAAERFVPARNPAAEAAWQRYLGIRPPYLLYLGQWKAYKNVPLLLDAFAQVLRENRPRQLVIAGNDPRHPEVPAAASRLPEGSVVLPGRLPEDAVPDLYRGAAAVLVPSRAEGFGLPVLEAMACGVTVVCSDIPVLRELADGVAIFCDPTSAASFAQGISEALGSSTSGDRIERGIARARTFSWQKAAEETMGIYERVLSA